MKKEETKLKQAMIQLLCVNQLLGVNSQLHFFKCFHLTRKKMQKVEEMSENDKKACRKPGQNTQQKQHQ